MDSASTVLFAIRSLIRLGQQASAAYVDAARRRELVLPIGDFFSSIEIDDVINYFKDQNFGKKYVDGDTTEVKEYAVTLRRLLIKPKSQLTSEDKQELIAIYRKCVNLDRAGEGKVSWQNGQFLGEEDLRALFLVHQWRLGTDPTPSTLQRVAGTIVEIGVDYARSSPDLFDKNSKKGKAVLGFLNGLDELNLPEIDLSELPSRLFVATMETAAEHTELMSGDMKIQEFIKASTKALSTDIAARLREINEDQSMDAIAKREARLRVQDWGELMYRTVLSSGGELVVSNPARYLGVEDREKEALITGVGGSVLDLLLADDGKLGAVFSRDGLEVVIKAALKVVGEHPEILAHTKNTGIKKVVAAMARELSQVNELLSRDLLPEVVRMALEKSGENLPLLWPDLTNRPEENLLVTAAMKAIAILSSEPGDGKPWKPRFRRRDILAVTETVLDELVANPGWLITEAGAVSGALEEVLETTLGVLRDHGDNRLSPGVGAEILQAALKAIVLRQEFVSKLPNGRLAVSAAVEAVLGTLFREDLEAKAAWQLVRGEVLTTVTGMALEKLARSDPDQGNIKKVKECLDEQIAAISQGGAFLIDALAECLDKKLGLGQ